MVDDISAQFRSPLAASVHVLNCCYSQRQLTTAPFSKQLPHYPHPILEADLNNELTSSGIRWLAPGLKAEPIL
jgi:hypothetical protein